MPTATREQQDTKLLQTVQQAIQSQRNYLLPMHSQTLVVDMFCRGLQNIDAYEPATGTLELTSESGSSGWAGYNLFRGTNTRTKSMLLRSTPKREAKPVGPDIAALEDAKLAKVVIDDFWHRFKVERNAHIMADAYNKSGVCICSFAYDTTQGDPIGVDPETGREIKTGRLVPRWDTADQWLLDPRGRTIEECEWAARISVQTTEKVVRWFPEHADKIKSMETLIGDGDLLQVRIQNATQWQRNGQAMTIKGKGRICVVEWYERGCEDYLEGRHGFFCGTTAVPSFILKDFGGLPDWCDSELPLVVGVQDVSSHCLLGNGTFMTDLIPAQREITKRAEQELLCADAVGNPKIGIPSPGGILNAHLTNDPFSPFIPFDPLHGPPIVLPAAQMGAFVKEAKEFALERFADMAPASPVDRATAQTTTSGFHDAIIQEEKRDANETFTGNWEDFWDATYKLYYRLWKASTIWPMQLRAIGPGGTAIYRRISGLDIRHDVEVGVVKGSMRPQSQIASTAIWLDLLGKGYGNPMTQLRPDVEARMLNDIGKGDMTATWADLEAPRDNAQDTLVRLIAGESIVPRIQDDPEISFSVIRAYMQTDQYRGRLLVDPHLEIRLTSALDGYGAILLAKQMSAMAMGMAAPGAPGAGGAPNPVQAAATTAAPGNPQGGPDGKAFQGMGTVPDPTAAKSGNPR